jgi:hypothetical protein
VYGYYEREKRNRNHERGMDSWNEGLKRLIEYTIEKRIIPWNKNKAYVCKIKN